FAGGGGVAWFPLAPGEVYYPAYRADVGYRRRINVTTVTNVTYITNVTQVTTVNYRNRAVSGAVTAVPERVFVGAQPVSRSVVRLAPGDLQQARVVGMAPTLAPTRASLAVAGPERRAPLPPQRLMARPVAATHAPPPAAVPFSAQERAIAANGGRPLAPAQVRSLPTSTPTGQPSRTFRSANAPAPGGRRLVRSAAPSAGRAPAPARAPERPAPSRAPERAAPVAPQRAADLPARPTPTAPAQPTAPQPRAAVPRPPASTLQRSYQAERATVETRHRQEFAQPKQGETPDALSRRQDAEDRDLDERYNQARAKNQRTMPPPKPAERAQPQERPQPQEQRAEPRQQPAPREESHPNQRQPAKRPPDRQ
ncbi:MAG TPA: hypothetical protein VE091_05580, partial [Gemmatimonadales bacterium]|nr:hypothetical protein [Gemmatimonadales bacterium]